MPRFAPVIMRRTLPGRAFSWGSGETGICKTAEGQTSPSLSFIRKPPVSLLAWLYSLDPLRSLAPNLTYSSLQNLGLTREALMGPITDLLLLLYLNLSYEYREGSYLVDVTPRAWHCREFTVGFVGSIYTLAVGFFLISLNTA